MIRNFLDGLRALRWRPRVALFIILPIALGIGANAALFTVVREVLQTALRFPDPDSIYLLEQDLPRLGGRTRFSSANYLDLVENSRAFQALTATNAVQGTLTGQEEPVLLKVMRISPSFFDVLGIRPARGRRFYPEEVAARPAGVILDHPPLVILSHKLWMSRFGGREDVVGSSVMLDGTAHEIVGVMHRDFFFPGEIDAWVPLRFGQLAPLDRGGFYLFVLGRLAPGVSEDEAREELKRIAGGLRQVVPQINEGMSIPIWQLQAVLVKDLRVSLWILFVLSVLMLVLVCANVAHLLLAQATARRREIAVRIAFGAGKGAIVRQLLTESLILAWLGCAGGLLIARWCLESLLLLAPPGLLPLETIAVDGGILGFALAAATLTGVLFGLAPALLLAHVNVRSALAEGGRSISIGRRHLRVQTGLVAVQLALSVVLLSSTSLLVKSYWNLKSVDPGFQPKGLLTLDLTLPQKRYPSAQALSRFVTQALEQTRAIPGVRSAAVALRLPILDSGGGIWFRLDQGPAADHAATFNAVTPEYLETFGLRVIHGRGITPEDRTGGIPVVLISQGLAAQFFPGQDPVGENLILTPWPQIRRRIVGVVGDVRQGGLKGEQMPAVYVPYLQLPQHRLRFAVRTSGDPATLLPAVRSRIWAVDPALGFEVADSMENRLAELLRPERFSMWLVGLFGFLGLVLAATGVYGSTAYFVEQQIPDLGIRLALGSRPVDLVVHVLRKGLVRTLLGLGIGLGATFPVTRFGAAMLYRVSPYDPTALCVTLLVMLSVVAVAIYFPARRAGKVDPAEVLRME